LTVIVIGDTLPLQTTKGIFMIPNFLKNIFNIEDNENTVKETPVCKERAGPEDAHLFKSLNRLPGFHVGNRHWYYRATRFPDEFLSTYTKSDVEKLTRIYEQIHSVYEKHSECWPVHVGYSSGMGVQRISKAWKKRLASEIDHMVEEYLNTDYLDSIQARGLECRDIVEVPNTFDPFSSTEVHIQRLPKRMVSTIVVETYSRARVGLSSSDNIMDFKCKGIERFNTYEFYELSEEDSSFLQEKIVTGEDDPIENSVFFIDDEIECWDQAWVDLDTVYVELAEISITTINGQHFTVTCIPEAVMPVIDRLNEAFGFYK